MSYQDGWAAINLEMPERVPHTEYSLESHWEVVRRSTGLVVTPDSPPDLKHRAALALMEAWNFDFRWSTLRDAETSQAAAVNWLCELRRKFPQSELHYVLGNHDCLAPFDQHLQKLAATLPRFYWHEYFLRLDSALFLHGDCAHARMDSEALDRYRQGWKKDRPRGRVGSVARGGEVVAERFLHDNAGVQSIQIQPRLGQQPWDHGNHCRRSCQVKDATGLCSPRLVQLCALHTETRVRCRVLEISLVIRDVAREVGPVRAFHLWIPREPLNAVEKALVQLHIAHRDAVHGDNRIPPWHPSAAPPSGRPTSAAPPHRPPAPQPASAVASLA